LLERTHNVCVPELRRAFALRGSDVHAMESILDAGLWDEPLLDPETCKTASLYLPVGPWASSTFLLR
jgi:hypothetical protein